MAKFCPECGHPIVDSSMPFCPKCGVKLPISSVEVQPPPSHQASVQQQVQPAYYTQPVSLFPTTFTESKSNKRPFFNYSNKFYIVIILDLLICSIIVFPCFSIFFDVSDSGYHSPIYIILGLVILINLIIDLFILNYMVNYPHTIDSNLCWIKSLFGFLGIFTVISGVYFLVISINMKRTYDVTIK